MYLRPAGLLRGAEAAAACAASAALPLAGGPFAFAGCLAIDRGEGGQGREERWLSIPELRDRADADPFFGRRLKRLSAPRPAFSGLTTDQPAIMGVVNVTPDSFSDGGRYAAPAAAVEHGLALAEAGAGVIDAGGESTRPGAQPVPPALERERLLPVISALVGAGLTVSVDTRNATTMREALDAGAAMVNDVSALTHDPDSPAIVAAAGCAVVLMHCAGDPRDMQDDPRYDDVVLDLYDYFEARLAACRAAGIAREQLILDPGFGFGKTPAHNMSLVDSLALFHGLGCPLLIGASRKSTIGRIAGGAAAAPNGRLPGSLALAQAAWDRGAQIVRVHDAAETAQARALWRTLDDSRTDG